MNENFNIFINKKILIYGIGKSGASAFNFLRRNNIISLFDDNKKVPLKKFAKKKLISFDQINKIKFYWLN